MRLTGFALLVVLSLGVAGYAMGVYGFLPQGAERPTLVLEAVPRRQSTSAEFDAKPLSTDEPRLLETAGSGNGVRALPRFSL
jgi:hypothetical protein